MRAMKDSGVEWIGEIPEGWRVCSARNVFSEVKTRNTDGQETCALQFKFGTIIRKTNFNATDDNYVAETITNYTVVVPGTIMVNGLNLNYDFKTQRVAIVKEKGIITSAYLALFPDEQLINAEFATYLLKGYESKMAFHNMGTGIRLTLGFREFKEQPILLPSLPEQQRIAAYLDEQCGEIDKVLAKTRESIEEYKKLKQSVITEAVTKGIRPDRPMKPSGNIWFEVIPETWGLKKVKYLFKIKKDIAGKEGFTVLSITQRGVKPKDLTKNEGQLAENYSKYQIVCPGDFAMNHMDLLTGWIDISKFHGVTSPDYRVFTLIDSEKQNPHYFLYMMQMCYSNRIFYGWGQGVSGMGRWRLQPDKFLNFTIPVPSLDEQQEIVAHLDQQCAEIDRLIAKKEQIITELESHKKSLIYECVTGKREVE